MTAPAQNSHVHRTSQEPGRRDIKNASEGMVEKTSTPPCAKTHSPQASSSIRLIDSKMREARRLHASVPSLSWTVLKLAQQELRLGRRFIASLSVVRKAIQSALADLEQAVQVARLAIITHVSTVNRTVKLLKDLRGYAQERSWRRYGRLLSYIWDDPSAVAARILLYWI